MANLISLTQIPNDETEQIPKQPMKIVLEFLDFQSILILRKVCHDLRNFIDDTKPIFHLMVIRVNVHPQSINLFLGALQPLFKLTETKPFFYYISKTNIRYVKKGNGCLVKYEWETQVKEARVEDEDFETVFCRDFNIFLRHQQNVLKPLRYNCGDPLCILNALQIILHPSGSTVRERGLENVIKSLKSLSHPLQAISLHMTMDNHQEMVSILPYVEVKSFTVEMNNREEIMSFFPFIDSNSSKTIKIWEREERSNISNLDQTGQLKQWKQAKELWIEGFQLEILTQKFKHFSKIGFGFRIVSIAQLLLLKGIFLGSSNLYEMDIDYDPNLSVAIRTKLIELFGEPFLVKLGEQKWFLKTPDTNRILEICYCHYGYTLCLSTIEQSDVPQNAAISN